MTLVYNDHPVFFYKRLDFVIFKTRLHKGYINNTMQRVRGRIKTPDWRKCLLPSSFLGNLIFCKIYVKKFRQTFMPLHKQCLGVYQNKCICLSSGNQNCGCNSLSKGCRCRQHSVGIWHEGINGIQLFIAFLSFECYANRFTMICIINYFIINFEGIQHVDNGILAPPRHCQIFIGKICTADNTRNVICGNTHRLFAVKFRIFERRNMFQMITSLI